MDPPQSIDHTVPGAYDAYLKTLWGLDQLSKPKGRQASAWAAVVTRLGHPLDDSPQADAGNLEAIPLVIRALEDHLPGVTQVLPLDKVPLASAQRALQLWTHHVRTNKADAEDFPEDVVNLRRQVRLSVPRDDQSPAPRGPPDGPAPGKGVRPPPKPSAQRDLIATGNLERALRDMVFEEDSDGPPDDPPPPKVPKKGTQTKVQVQKEVNDLSQQTRERVFANLPLAVTTCKYTEAQLLMCDDWPSLDPFRVYSGLQTFFTRFSVPKGCQSINSELKAFCAKDLSMLVDRVYRVKLSSAQEFPYVCRDTDIVLREMDRKRNIILHGTRIATQIEHRLKTFEKSAPTWVKAREMVLAGPGFRLGAQEDDAPGNTTPQVEDQ